MTDQKPRFTRVIKDGQMWLRDREDESRLVGPFESWAEALGYMKDKEREVHSR